MAGPREKGLLSSHPGLAATQPTEPRKGACGPSPSNSLPEILTCLAPKQAARPNAGGRWDKAHGSPLCLPTPAHEDPHSGQGLLDKLGDMCLPRQGWGGSHAPRDWSGP